jgi:hypothetical protein
MLVVYRMSTNGSGRFSEVPCGKGFGRFPVVPAHLRFRTGVFR